MLTLIFALPVSILFYIIAIRNQQNGAEPACLSVIIFYIGLFSGIFVLGKFLGPLLIRNGIFESFANVSLIAGFTTGIIATIFYYFWLKKNWKEKRIESSVDILDDEIPN